jgi:hypothetical protein
MTPDDPLSSLWRSTPTEAVKVPDLAAMRAREGELRSLSLRRGAREIFTLLTGIGFAALLGALFESRTVRAGCAALVLGQIVVLVALGVRGRPGPAPTFEAPTEEHLAYLRRELVRERDLRATVWWWYLGPLLPGLLLVGVGTIVAVGRVAPVLWTWLNVAVWVASTVAIQMLLARQNRRASEKLAREIRALDAGGGK